MRPEGKLQALVYDILPPLEEGAEKAMLGVWVSGTFPAATAQPPACTLFPLSSLTAVSGLREARRVGRKSTLASESAGQWEGHARPQVTTNQGRSW